MAEVMEAEKDRREMGIEEEGEKKQRKDRKTQRRKEIEERQEKKRREKRRVRKDQSIESQKDLNKTSTVTQTSIA